MELSYMSEEFISALGIEDFTAKKDYGRDRGANPIISEVQQRDIDKLNQRLNSKSVKSKKKDEDAEEDVISFDLKSKPRVILHQGAISKRTMNSIVQHSSRRYAYLLNDVLLLTAVPSSSSSSSKINLNHVIPLDQVSLIDLRAVDSNEDGGAFEIRTPERPYQIVAESESEKRIWLEELESAIFSFMSTREVRKLGWNHAVIRHTFYSAAFYGDLPLLQKHIDRMGAENIDIVDESGMAALHWAALGGQLDAVRYILDKGADIDCLNGGLNSPLMLAAALGQHNVVLYLLNCGADVDIRNMKDFDCLLMAAIFDNYSSGLFEAVQVLKLRGVDINKQDLSGGSSLHQCTSRNLPTSIQILVDCGADVNSKHGRSGLTPLQMACSGQYPDAETVRILLDKGAMPNWKDSSNNTAFGMILLTHKKNAGSKDADTSSSTGLKATVDEVTDFVTTALPVLLEITRKGGRFEPDSIAFLRNSFQDMINSGRQHWLNLKEPDNFGEFIRTRDDTTSFQEHDNVKWTSNNASQNCLMCLDKFTMANRRHHCRSCGVLCCDLCSSKRLKLPLQATGSGKVNKGKPEGERVCDSCFNRLVFGCSEWTQALNSAKKVQKKLEASVRQEMEKKGEVFKSASTGSLGSSATSGSRSPVAGNISATTGVANETLQALQERGQKINELADKSEQMKSAADDFRKMTRQLVQQQQNAKGNGW